MDDFELDEPLPNGPDEEANRKAAEAQLQNYHKAMQEEWEQGEKFTEGKLTPTEIRTKSKDLLTQAVPKAIASMLYLAQHGTSEQTRLKASTYIIDKAIGREIGGLVGDPMDALLQDIRQKSESNS